MMSKFWPTEDLIYIFLNKQFVYTFEKVMMFLFILLVEFPTDIRDLKKSIDFEGN